MTSLLIAGLPFNGKKKKKCQICSLIYLELHATMALHLGGWEESMK